jgi:hypothetical protein
MPIFQAIGLGVLIMVLKFFVPPIFEQLESTILAFLHGAELSATIATQLIASAGAIQFPVH